MLPLRYRENSAGTSFRRVRSPLAPKMTSVSGRRFARQAQSGHQRVLLHSVKWYIIEEMETSRGAPRHVAATSLAGRIVSRERAHRLDHGRCACCSRAPAARPGRWPRPTARRRDAGRVPGRSWISSPGESLLATVVLRVPELGFPLRGASAPRRASPRRWASRMPPASPCRSSGRTTWSSRGRLRRPEARRAPLRGARRRGARRYRRQLHPDVFPGRDRAHRLLALPALRQDAGALLAALRRSSCA